jgi:peptidyl-tRNA hydrolase, PTH2 family
MSHETKQVIVIRKDLKMRRGKECSMCSHASMAFITKKMIDKGTSETGDVVNYKISLDWPEASWINTSFRKITCYVESEDELIALHEKAMAADLESHIVEDNGLTEFHGVKTKTCLAIGPDLDSLIDPITKHLPLY